LGLRALVADQEEGSSSTSTSRRLRSWHYLAGLNLILLAVAISAAMLYRHPPVGSVFHILYGFGPVVRAIVVEHRFGMRDVSGGYWAYATRLPFVPLLLAGLTFLFHTYNAVFLVKNAIFSLFVLFTAVKLSLTPLKTMLLVASVYLLPPHASIVTAIEVEEGYLLFFVIGLAATLFTRRKSDYFTVGLLVAAIYLTKSSMIVFCFAAVAIVAAQDLACQSFRLRSYIPFLALCLAAGSWGLFVYQATGVFAFGTDASSWNGWNFYKGNNATALRYYPRTNLDVLDVDGSLDPPPTVHVSNEWDRHRWQLDMGRRFVAEHRRDVLQMDLKKLEVLLYDVGETPRMLLPTHLFRMTLIMDHLLFGLAVILACCRRDKASLVFGILVMSYVLPYFTSFLYQRHLVPMYGLVYCFVLYCWQNMPRSTKKQKEHSYAEHDHHRVSYQL
jgi:hypothetical protein